MEDKVFPMFNYWLNGYEDKTRISSFNTWIRKQFDGVWHKRIIIESYHWSPVITPDADPCVQRFVTQCYMHLTIGMKDETWLVDEDQRSEAERLESEIKHPFYNGI